jgi:hypothetical protein
LCPTALGATGTVVTVLDASNCSLGSHLAIHGKQLWL